jgi:hypothetical protein
VDRQRKSQTHVQHGYDGNEDRHGFSSH